MRLPARLTAIVLAGLWASGACAAPEADRQAELLHLLRHDCGSCHGMTMKGGLGPALLPQSLAGKPDLMLVETIMNGRPGTAMPPWKSTLTRGEAGWLVGILRKGGSNAR